MSKYLIHFFLFLPFFCSAQDGVQLLTPTKIKERSKSKAVAKASYSELNQKQLRKIFDSKKDKVEFSVLNHLGKPKKLLLAKVNLFTADFEGIDPNNREAGVSSYNPDIHGVHYQVMEAGVIKGSASIYQEQLQIMYTEGNDIINIKPHNGKSKYISYAEKGLVKPREFNCGTETGLRRDNDSIKEKVGNNANRRSAMNNCVSVTVYQAYNSFGDAYAMMSAVAAIYATNGIGISVRGIYLGGTGGDLLTQLDQGSNPAGSSVTLYISGYGGGGIASTIGSVCNSRSVCVSGGDTEVSLAAHEIGHLLGAEHTHDCAWNGNNTPIDGCGSSVNGCGISNYFPPNGGTIMSYCHTQATGLNLQLHPQVADRMRNYINNNNYCGGGCGSSPPNNCSVTFTNVGCEPVDLYWNNVSNLVYYATIEPKGQHIQNTYRGHVWEVKKNNVRLATYLIDCENTNQTIYSGGADSDNDGICDFDDQCPNLNDNIIGASCDDNNPNSINDTWQSDCTCAGIIDCTEGGLCETDYGPNTGTFDANCNCNLAPCKDPDKLAGNCDLDGDGILNGDDLDDDNDGIIDLEECPLSNVITNASFNGPVANPANLAAWEIYGSGYNAATEDISTGAGGYFPPNLTPTNSSDGGTWVGLNTLGTIFIGGIQQQVELQAGSVYTISFEQANFGIDESSSTAGNTNAATGSPGQIEILINSGTDQPTTVAGTGPIINLGPGWEIVSFSYTAQVSGVHTVAIVNRYKGTDEFGKSYIGVDGFQMTPPFVDCDVDGDNIPNQYDKDSDDDGCADAYDGGAAIAPESVSNGSLIGAVNPTTGIPTVVGAGQPVGSSQDASVQANDCIICDDADGDDICDNEDSCPGLNNNLIGTGCNDGNTNTENDIWQSNCTCIGTPISSSRISARVFMEGYYNGNNGLTRNSNYASLIPSRQPFNVAPWFYNGIESVTNIPANVIDWILMVTRTANGDILEQKAGFITTTGEVMDIDGSMGIAFSNTARHFSVHHKSHLAVMSATAYTTGTYDFTADATKAMGNGQQIQQGNRYMMYSGDYDCNGIINNLDYNLWQRQGATISQYLSVDGDGNGIINNLDYNLWTKNRSKIGHPPLRY